MDKQCSFFTTKQLASHLEVTGGTIATWRKFGYGPTYYKIGRQHRYNKIAVYDWEKAQENEQ